MPSNIQLNKNTFAFSAFLLQLSSQKNFKLYYVAHVSIRTVSSEVHRRFHAIWVGMDSGFCLVPMKKTFDRSPFSI